MNLFVSITRIHPGANPPEYFTGVVQSVAWAILHGPVLLILHTSLGLLLVVASIGLLARAISSRVRGLIGAASLGAFGVLAAGFNGGSILNYNEDFSSMIMASFFAMPVGSYISGLFVSDRAPA